MDDIVFCRQVAKAIGNDGMSKLVEIYKASGDYFEAAKAEWARVSGLGFSLMEAPLHEVLLLLEQSIENSRGVQQLAYDVNGKLVHACPLSQSHHLYLSPVGQSRNDWKRGQGTGHRKA